MDKVSLDDEPAVNFKTATLEIAKDPEGSEGSSATKIDTEDSSKTAEQTSFPKDISYVPFKNVDVHTFFTDRKEVVERAIKDCHKFLKEISSDDIIGSWLLTEISIWDTEKERLVLLTTKYLYSMKYDFISLKILEYSQVPLINLDTVVIGELIYPSSSLTPRLNGLAEVMSYVINCAVRQEWSSLTTCSNLTQFEPRKRHMLGIRLMWNKGHPLSLSKKWNPFAKNIPWLTYASHPLFWHRGSEMDKAKFDVEAMHAAVLSLLPEECNMVTGSIIVENYCGIGALVHNRNALGFFKVRGKVSF
ncbi:tumor protein p63-regulated gene 1-like protein isoform X1 [Vespa velutina]|uniref:tumor protein p63-regulated gene 1-like protein isoform X1 n=1 Tax=Vespa velutina TaxID=202808 RepID=UPI001FB34E90|nr:tumor protein p63-regulated gene 1-like protein isoform X1 [Vespa velutina]